MELKENVEKLDEFEIFCSDCTGELITVEVPRTTAKIFTPQYYKKLQYKCNKCSKSTKEFFHKIKKG